MERVRRVDPDTEQLGERAGGRGREAKLLVALGAAIVEETGGELPLENREHGILRFAFLGRADGPEPGRRLDKEIIAALWLTPAELAARRAEHRSPLVQQCVDDFLAGRSFALDVLSKAYG